VEETFEPHEFAILVNCANHPEWNGREVMVMGPLGEYTMSNGYMTRTVMCYPFTVPGVQGVFGAMPRMFRKLDSRDHGEASDWSRLKGIFQPQKE